jgi:hypothetical protein
VQSLEQELDAARECFRNADEDARSFSLAAHDARERLACIEEKARQIAVIEGRALEADELEDKTPELESSLKAAEGKRARGENSRTLVLSEGRGGAS